MKLLFFKVFFIASIFCVCCTGKPIQQGDPSGNPEITFRENPRENRIDVLIEGKLFTSYRWPENVYKPILYPLVSSGGREVTRGFPLEPREGERNDHRHQVGN